MLALILTLLVFTTPRGFDALWREYNSAGTPAGRETAWTLLKSEGWPADYDSTLQRLRARRYPSFVPTGELHEERVDQEGLHYPYTVLVPKTYDPKRSYPLRMILHGSTRHSAWRDGVDHWRNKDPFRSATMITVFPAAWEDAMWWTQRQVDNLSAILDLLRARYHIDSNRCSLMGLSDGGTGTFYQALRAPSPWACFLPLIGHPWVLRNEREGVSGDIFAANLKGRALMVVNGRDDPLYPAKALKPYLDLFERAGATIDLKVEPGGHSVRWWPQESQTFREFRAAHSRDPLPDSLVWETDDPQHNGRCSWVIIESIGNEAAPDPDPLNTVLFPDLNPPRRAQAFPRHGPSGRLSARRQGNTITVTTRNVRRFKLLLGAGEFDFTRPIEVVVDGKSTQRRLKPSVQSLMKWSIRDGDPELLIAAEIEYKVPH
ncbi:MAG TPA: hypothetical protein VKA63_08665 [Candidatus Krumholzibacteria bacterium]|nr:hypothetical protein [Candidatus Krumholzibacteria bacterium]